MPAEQVAAIRKLASAVTTQDESAALTEMEHVAFTLARAVLALIAENDRLKAVEKHKG